MRDTYSIILASPVLSKAFKYIINNNTSNNAPYHNLHHMVTVTKCLFEGYGQYKDVLNADYDNIMLSGMFHDMNHSMGEESDELNVQYAIDAFLDFYNDNLELLKGSVDKEMVKSMIKATQYPYVIADEDLTLNQQLIRDSDLMVVLEPDWFQNTMIGLGIELGVNDIPKMIISNINFHKSINMRTEWAQDKYEKEWPSFIEEIEKMNVLMTD